MDYVPSRSRLSVIAFISLQAFIGSAFAAGFQLNELSPGLQGAATAGAAAAEDDVSAMFINPATLATLKHNQLYAGASLIMPHVSMSDASATHTVNIPGPPPTDITATVLGKTSQKNVGQSAVVPDVYLSWRLNEMIVAGIAVTSPFGLTTDYSRNSVVRFAAQDSQLLTVNINPAVGIKLNKYWAVGLGFQAQYAQATLSNFNGPYTGIPSIDELIAANHPTSLKANGWGYGYNAGILFEPSECTRIGMGYRSRLVQNIEGDGSQFTLPGPTVPAPSQNFLFNARTTANGTLVLPAVLTLSAAQDISNWTLKASAQLNFWSSFEHLSINMPEAFGTNSTIQSQWKDVFLYAVGADYRVAPNWTLRAGAVYDETPTRDGLRDPRIPDGDRIWATVGFTYKANKSISIDGVYEHIFGKDISVNVTQASGSSANSSGPLEVNHVRAKYRASVDILGLAIRYSFC